VRPGTGGTPGRSANAIAIEECDLRGIRPAAERVDHVGDERAIVLEHLVLERITDQFAFGPRRFAGIVEQPCGVMT